MTERIPENAVELKEQLEAMDREFLAIFDKIDNIRQAYLNLCANIDSMELKEVQDRAIYLARRTGNLAMMASSLYKNSTSFLASVPGASDRLIDQENHRLFSSVRSALFRFVKFFWSMRKMVLR